MKTEPQFVDVTLYSHWATALLYGDYSGLEPSEEAELDAWLDSEASEYGMFVCVGVSDDKEHGTPDIRGALPWDVSTYQFQVA